jgi:hypothetical protein
MLTTLCSAAAGAGGGYLSRAELHAPAAVLESSAWRPLFDQDYPKVRRVAIAPRVRVLLPQEQRVAVLSLDNEQVGCFAPRRACRSPSCSVA